MMTQTMSQGLADADPQTHNDPMAVASAKYDRAMKAFQADGPKDGDALLADLRPAYATALRCDKRIAAINFGQPLLQVLTGTGQTDEARTVLDDLCAALIAEGHQDFATQLRENVEAALAQQDKT